MAKWIGTTVPNTGYVENIYLNNELSVDEVVSLLETAQTEMEGAYFLLATEDISQMIFAMKDNPDDTNPDLNFWVIGSSTGTVYFSEHSYYDDDFGNVEAGWNYNVTYPISINSNVVPVVDMGGEIPFGTYNDKLTSLFSSTPFTQEKETIADKLQTLIDGKQYVVDKTNAKAGSDLKINSTWQSIGNTIEELETAPSLQEKTTTPTKETQTITPDEDYNGLSKVVVEPIPDNYIEPSGTKNIVANGTYDVTEYSNVEVEVEFEVKTHSTTVSPSEEDRIIYPMDGYDGLSSVTVYKIPNQYIIPSGTVDIVKNGVHDISQYQYVNVLVPTGGSSELPTNLSNMFYGNTQIQTLDNFCINWLDYSKNATNLNGTFRGCTKLLKTPTIASGSAANISNMFYGDSVLKTIDLSDYAITNATYSQNAFYNCYSLTALIIRKFTNYAINTNAFTNCYHLQGRVNSSYNPEGLTDGYIYVPSADIIRLNTATGWSAYKSQFRALEDYTVDGTTTGMLDESKVNA